MAYAKAISKTDTCEKVAQAVISRRIFLKASAITSCGTLATSVFAAGNSAESGDGTEGAKTGRDRIQASNEQLLEFVSVGDFGAIGDGDPKNAEANSKAIQAALDAGKTVYLGDEGHTFAIAKSLRMHPGQKVYGDGATLIASERMSEILYAADDAKIEGIVFDANNRQPINGVPIQATGAIYGINIRDISGCRVTNCTFTRYKRGVSVTSSGPGVKCNDHLFENCGAVAGFAWPYWRSGSEQVGAYVGSEAQPVIRSIPNYSKAANGAEDVCDIRFVNWSILEGQYGLALHRCTRVEVEGGNFREMSRAISIQHQSRDIRIRGVTVENADSAGIHIAQGSHQIVIEGNSIYGTMANDNAGIQGYYGVRDIIVRNNSIDSRYDTWRRGSPKSPRKPGAAIRFGQQAERVTISNNAINGYRWGVLLKTTIYEDIMQPSDPNYFASGVRNFRIEENEISGDYFSPWDGTTTREAHPKEGTYGVLITISGPWEDTELGGWHVDNIAIRRNRFDNVGTSLACLRNRHSSPSFLENAIEACGNLSVNANTHLSAPGLKTVLDGDCISIGA